MAATGTPLPRTSKPAARALAGHEIACLEDLARHSRAEIAALHGMGPKALAILEEALREAGLGFRPASK